MKLSIVYKLSLTSIILVLVTASLVAVVFYNKTTNLLIDNKLANIADEIQISGNLLKTHIKVQNQDTIFLADTPPIQGILRALKTDNYDHQASSSYLQWTQRLQSIFTTLLKSKPEYLAFHFIDKNGQELVVVKRNAKNIVAVNSEQLQNKQHRDYVVNTLKLNKGEIFLSEINLNREYTKVSEPHQEVLRSATPIYDKQNGELAGLLVGTLNFGLKLRQIQNSIQNDTRKIYITNDQGSYILHPDASKTYGFDLGKNYKIQEDIPSLAKLYLPDNRDSKFILLPEKSHTNYVINVTKVHFDPAHPLRFIAVGITEQYSAIVEKQSAVLNEVLFFVLILAIVITLLAIFFSYRLSLPIKQITQVVDDYIHHRKSTSKLPLTQNDEIGILARSYASMISQVQEAQISQQEINQKLESKVSERTLALETSEILQRSILENIVDGILTIDEKGIVKSYNPSAEKIFGYTADEVIGHNIKILMPEPYHSEHDMYLSNYQQSQVKKIIGIGREVAGQRKNGTIFPLDLAVSELIVNGQKLFTGVVRDITERKQMEKMKNEFISTVSHELRTPLTSIRGSLGLLSGGILGDLPDSASEMLKIASNNTERLLLLINDILDIQKIEAGKINYNFADLELKPFLQQALIDHSEYGKQYGVTFELGQCSDNAKVFADKDRLMQVMGNLLSNAAKFSPDGEIVEVSVSQLRDNSLRIAVSDHGPGITEEFQPLLFDRFTQSDASDTRAKGGTGLGLAITKVIVEKHGGKISFISKKDVGSTFYIDLPQVGNQQKTTTAASSSTSASNLPCILIVEKDAEIASYIKENLAETGFNAQIAYDTKQARQLLLDQGNSYQLMILNIVLPDKEAISLLSELRKDEKTRDLEVIVLSVQANKGKPKLFAKYIGLADWMTKPIQPKSLIDVVKLLSKGNHQPRVLHVEDDEDVHSVVKQMLKNQCELIWTTTVCASRQVIQQANIDLVLLDIGLPDGSGLDLIDDIEQLSTAPKIIIFSAQEVSDKYTDRVNAILVKSKTKNKQLLDVVIAAIK